MYTITVAGPKPSAEDARTALAAAGFDVRATEIEQDEARIIVRADDVDAARSAVEPYDGWHLQTAIERGLEPAGA